MATDCCSTERSAAAELQKEVLRIKCEPEFGHRVLTNRIKPFLERYQQTGNATSRDKEICDELLEAIDVSNKLNERGTLASVPPPRPRTVASARGEAGRHHEPPIFSDCVPSKTYTTSYQASYKPVEGQLLHEVTRPLSPKRPLSSYPFGASYNLGDPVGTSTYDVAFNRVAPTARERLGRLGASSETRNNPHPLETFMVWRFPREQAPKATAAQQPTVASSRYFPTNENVDDLYGPLKLSTYKYDYEKTAEAAKAVRQARMSGKPMSFDFDDAKPVALNNPPYTVNTTQRSSFKQYSNVNQALRPTTTRFGSNKNKSTAFPGITPLVSDVRLNLKTRTHYDQEVNDRAVDVYNELSTRTTIPHGRCVKRPPSTIMPGMPVDS